MYTHAQRIIASIAGILVLGLLGGYVYIQSRDFLHGPTIIVNEPAHGNTYSKKILSVRGTARNITKLTLNGQSIHTDENGFFDEITLLSLGYNIIELRAEDRFNREKLSRLEIVYKP